MKTVMFCFGGRRANLELQLPFIRRILLENPDIEYDLWDLAHNEADHQYIQSITGERINIRSEFYNNGDRPWQHFNDVFRFYATEAYRNTRFIKIDDDVVFMQPERIGLFIGAIDDHPGQIVSAKTINNGATTPIDPALWAGFKALAPLRLLDVHKSAAYAEMCHQYFFSSWEALTSESVVPLVTQDWLSINLIGYNWRTGCQIARRVGGPSPGFIAGRRFRRNATLGDEGMCNTLPRVILQGFLAAHLNFGPQEKDVSEERLSLWRKQYATIGEIYLCGR